MDSHSPSNTFESLHFRISSDRDVLVFTFIDSHLAREDHLSKIFTAMREKLELLDELKVSLDFSQVEFVASSLLGQLVALKRWVDEHGGKMNICNLQTPVYESLRITRLDDFFAIHDSAEKAAAAIADPNRSTRISQIIKRTNLGLDPRG